MIKSFLIGASAIVLTHSLAAQQLNTRRLDSLFSIYETGDRATGSIAISKNGQLLYKKVTGTADQKHPATENSLYRIGSISKTFTAALIMQLVDQQKLSLDQTLEGYFSRLPNAKTMTIRHLLNHTSGIPDYTASEEYIGYYTVDIKSKELEKVICDFQPSVLPGEMFQYSNSNYALLTFLLEKVNEQSYSELLTAKIINPLGLKQTFFDEEHPVVESYTFEEKWKTEANTKLCVSLGAGGIISTPGDLNTFYTALFNGKLISPAALKEMMTINTQGYGLGLMKIPFYESFAYGHTGGIDGFRSNSAYFPADSISISYVSNRTRYPINDIMIGVLSIIYDKPYQLPDFTEIKLDAEELKAHKGKYISKELPIKIQVDVKNNHLWAQATGQDGFELTASKNGVFSYPGAGIEMIFSADKKQFTLKQGGGSFLFTRE